MQLAFNDKQLEKIFNDESYVPKGFHENVIKGFVKAVSYLENAENITELYGLKSLHYEKLEWKLNGKHSIRVNKQRRLIFTLDQYWNITVVCIEELSKHYE